jgi:hypothetical protein
MNWYFFTLTLVNVVGLGAVLALHGEQRRGSYNFWQSLLVTGLLLFLTIMAIRKGF